jgi:hypothetical protein
MARAFTQLTFTDAVKETQRRYGTRDHAARLEASPDARDALTPELIAFIAERDGFFIATANAEGWPHVQHRGGPKGFLKVLDQHSLGFADFAGNKQFLTMGNLAENDRVCLFLLDYAEARRVKLWGHARIVEDPALLETLIVPGYHGKAERAVRIEVAAWDINCRQHITRRFSAAEIAPTLAQYEERIAALQARIAELQAKTGAL